MHKTFLTPPIVSPIASDLECLSSAAPHNRPWNEAPFVVRICAFYLTLFAGLAAICGLFMIAYVYLLRSQFLSVAICILGVSALIFAIGWHLIALRQSKKIGWYIQMIWSVGLTVIWVVAMFLALISGTIQTVIEETLKTASPLGAYISLSHLVVSLFWFRPKVKKWFGITPKKRKI